MFKGADDDVFKPNNWHSVYYQIEDIPIIRTAL